MACKRSGVQIPSAPHKIMKKFLFETKELILSQGTIAILAIVQIRIVAKSLGPESYGIIGVYLGIIGLCFRFLSSRNSDLLLINFKSHKGNFLKSSIIFELLMGIISLSFALLLMVISVNFELLNIESIPIYLIIFVFSRIFLNLLEVFKGMFTHIGDMKIYSLVETLNNILRFILVVGLILYDPTIKNFFFALTLHSFITGFIVLFILIAKNTNQNKKVGLKEYFNLSRNNFLKIRADQAVGLIPAQLDVVVIGLLTDFYSAGIYRVARKLVEPVNYIVVALSPWMLNKISSNDKFDFRNLTYRILIPISGGLLILYISLGEELIRIIAGIDYINSYQPLLILLIGYLSYLLTFWTRHYLFLNNLILQHTIGRSIYLVIFVVLSSLLIDKFSYSGVALSITIGMICQKIYELFIYFQTNNLNK
jgi:O-antigen/teichoic acid export membrane protein